MVFQFVFIYIFVNCKQEVKDTNSKFITFLKLKELKEGLKEILFLVENKSY